MADLISVASSALPPGTRTLAFRGAEAISTLYRLERAPAHTVETLVRYRITAEQKAAIDEHWRARMADTATRAQWDDACRIYRTWLAKQGL